MAFGWLIVLVALMLSPAVAQATLAVQVEEPNWTGSQAFVRISMRNTGTNSVQSARAVMFLFDDQGKVLGQRAAWVIGGTKEKPGLAPAATARHFFVIPTDKAVKKTKVTFTRIILDNGRILDAGKGYQFE